VYAKFLTFVDLHSPERPVVICEGKTDNVYIRGAVRSLHKAYPLLVTSSSAGLSLRFRLFRYTDTTRRIMHLGGGAGAFCRLIKGYARQMSEIKAPGFVNPVILLIDNDDAARGIYNSIAEVTGVKPSGKDSYYHVVHNLYVVPTPLSKKGGSTTIEDFFPSKLKNTKLSGKTFHVIDKTFDPTVHYGKHLFAEAVVRKNLDKIDFSGFAPILDRISAVIQDHKP
jgi:hypothetical protein